MSEEIGRQIEDAAAARSREASSRVDRARLADSIVAGATRRRRVRGFATAAFAVVGVLAVAGGTVAAMAAWGPDAVAPATQGATPSATVPAESSASPSPTVTAPVADVGLDGIADYPALAAARGEGFPSAYVMEDWVWDHVGPGWSLESYSMRLGAYVEPAQEAPNPVVYLVSPDGAAFELVALDHAQSTGLRVVSWREDERTATVWWEGDGTNSGDAAELDLQTGALDPLDFTMPGKIHSRWETPIAVAADGTELWEAGASGVAPRFYRWSHADGWTVAAINALPGLGTTSGFSLFGEFNPGPAKYVRDDGNAVVLERVKDGGDPDMGDPPIEIATYNLARDVVTLTQVPPSFEGWELFGWPAPDTLEYVHQSADLTSISSTVVLRGAPAQGPVPAEFNDGPIGQTGRSAVVGFGEATARGVFFRVCGC